MINPTDDDIGRAVVYRPNPRLSADGVITSFNADYVFVRYGNDHGSQATKREALHWVNEKPAADGDDDTPKGDTRRRR